MLVAYRLAGLSALKAHYADLKALAQFRPMQGSSRHDCVLNFIESRRSQIEIKDRLVGHDSPSAPVTQHEPAPRSEQGGTALSQTIAGQRRNACRCALGGTGTGSKFPIQAVAQSVARKSSTWGIFGRRRSRAHHPPAVIAKALKWPNPCLSAGAFSRR